MSTTIPFRRPGLHRWRRGLPLDRKIAVLFATNAVINWALSMRGIVDSDR
jgi:hypothetical protein